MTPDTFFDNFALLTDAPNAVAKLREIVLQLAVRGKLLPQDPNDAPASNQIEKIKANKQKIWNGKRDRNTQFDISQVPYSIPRNWQWTKLSDIVTLKSGSTVEASLELEKGEILYLKVSDMNLPQNGKEIKQSTRHLSRSPKIENQIIPANSIIFPKRGGAIGTNKKRLVRQEICVDSNTMAMLCHEGMELEYLYTWFMTIDLWKLNSGTSVPQINNKDIEPLFFPFPPLAEQKRIVEKCDRLLVLCDEIEKRQQQRQSSLLKMNEGAISQLLTAQNPNDFHHHWQRLFNNFDLLYSIPETIPKLRQAILQLAVQGKLVPQNPTDDAASILFERIKTRKEALIKQKIIKKASPLPPLDPENIPYLLPENWMWVRLDDISDIGTGSTPLTSNSDYYLDGEIPWITSTATSREFIDSAETYITETAVSDYRLRLYPPGSLIVALYGQGRTRGQISQLRISATINQACAAIVFFEAADGLQTYIKRVFQKKYDELRELAAGGAQPNLNVGKIKETLIPLPPLAEQKRIVAKVDALLSLCDTLEAKLKAARDSSTTLMEIAAKQILVA